MFSILGVQKLKERGAVQKRLSHHLRGHDVRNADPARAALNHRQGLAGDAAAVTDAIWQRTDAAMQRKDGVRVVELMLTASPDWFAARGGTGKVNDLFQQAKAFLRETFGRENVVSFGLHRDEQTPHIWAIITPILDGKLRASHWLDGPEKMMKLHDAWATRMEPFGLQRGSKKSGAKHVDVRTYYSAVNGSKNAQETISREMSRRAARAKKKAIEAEAKIAEIAEREAKSRAIHAALTTEQQQAAAQRFAHTMATSPPPPPIKPPDGPDTYPRGPVYAPRLRGPSLS